MTDDFIVIDSDLPAMTPPGGESVDCRRCRDAEILQSGLHILNYAYSTEALYEGILSVLTKIVPFSDAAILMPTENGGLETTVNHAGKLDLRLATLEGVFAQALDGEAILAPDLHELEGWDKASAGSTTNFASGLIVPLKSVEEPGIIACVHVDQPFDKAHLRALETFAPIAAQAVQWAKQQQKMERHRDQLEEEVRERTKELAEQKDLLSQALEKELELSGLQRQFVSMVCHEFRTPLAIIDGSAQRIARRYDKITPERLLGGIEKVRTSVTRLTDLIESVLNAARLETGQIKFAPKPFALGTLIEEVCGNYRELNPNYKIHTETDGLKGDLVADVTLLRQVLSNLVGNAIKYSPEGTHVWVRGVGADDGGVLISVRDNGVGIAKGELEKLFQRFYRGSSSTGIVGTGIGLHLAKTLIDLHGGTIDVASELGKGTTFTISLPPDLGQSHKEAAVDESAA